jgi:hypothetical protein
MSFPTSASICERVRRQRLLRRCSDSRRRWDRSCGEDVGAGAAKPSVHGQTGDSARRRASPAIGEPQDHARRSMSALLARIRCRTRRRSQPWHCDHADRCRRTILPVETDRPALGTLTIASGRSRKPATRPSWTGSRELSPRKRASRTTSPRCVNASLPADASLPLIPGVRRARLKRAKRAQRLAGAGGSFAGVSIVRSRPSPGRTAGSDRTTTAG